MAKHSNFWFETCPTRRNVVSGLVKNVDTLIIGGGITGIILLYNLIRSGHTNTFLVEESSPGYHCSGRSSGQLVLRGFKNFTDMPEDVAAEYITFLGESQRKLLSGLRASRLDFDLNDSGGLHLAISDAEMDTLEKEAAFIRKHRDIECPVLDSKEVNNLLPSKSFKGGIFIPTEATFNPYKVINGMVRLIERDGARILTDTQVQEVTRKDDGFTVSIRHKGVIRAKQIVYCTNAYSSELLPELSSCMVPARGQMLATSRLPETVLSVLPPMSMMCNNGCEYFRVYDDRLLVGGMRHAVRGRQEGILYDGEVSQAVYDRLRKFVGDHLPFVPTSFTHTWSGIMCMTRDGLPLVGPIPNKPNEYIAAGFNGYGYSHALMSSMIIKDYLTKDKSTLPGARIFDPARLV